MQLFSDTKTTSRGYRSTRNACYVGILIQAVINNLSPLLFVIFMNEFSISYSTISMLVLINFVTQICVDICAVRLVDLLGYRLSGTFAHILSAAGLFLLGVLPNIMPNAFLGLAVPTVIYAAGSGFFEVISSPIIDSLPGEHKASDMAMLHSFYCWGQVVTVLLTTLLLKFAGSANWSIIPMLWSLLPIFNLFNFLSVPLVPPISGAEKMPLKSLFSAKFFIAASLLMLCAGAGEISLSQWSSTFAEKSLNVPKMTGDLLGPCMFAVFMGTGRMLYGFFGHKLRLNRMLMLASVLCVISYLITSLSPWPLVSLLGCALCGFSVSIMWPGVISMSAERFPSAGTAMFALMAMFGDVGCSVGPTVTGVASDIAVSTGIGMDGLRFGILLGAFFPLVMVVLLIFMRDKQHS